MKIKLLVLLILSAACSSAPQKAPQAAPEPQQSSSYDLTDVGDEEQARPVKVDVPADSNVNHDTLRQALSAGDQKKVTDIASQLLARNPKDVLALNALGVQQMRNGKPSMARLIFKKALDVDPKNAGVLNNFAVTFLAEKEESRAVGELKKALEANGQNPNAAANIGYIHLKYRNYAAAKSMLEIAYNADRTNTKVANDFGLALRGTGDGAGARRVYEQALDKDPKDLSLLVNYASVLVENLGDKTKGQEILNKIKFLATDAATMERVRQLEAKIK
jgi:Flp pilus assembly protein TadD